MDLSCIYRYGIIKEIIFHLTYFLLACKLQVLKFYLYMLPDIYLTLSSAQTTSDNPWLITDAV